ncbi:MAG: GNAT family N-acetyltransferase [Pseudomonadota bacterium]
MTVQKDKSAVRVRAADWDQDRDALRRIRHEVFVVGQNVPVDLEWDGEDVDCDHALAFIDGDMVGTGRLTPAGKIGRMAVLAAARGQQAGAAILTHLVSVARARGQARVVLNAQCHALTFYERAGFVAEGPRFDEAGIAHQRMVLELGDSSGGTTDKPGP